MPTGEISSGIPVPSLVMVRVLSRLEGAAGALVVLLVGLEGFEAFLDATLAKVCW